MKKWSHFFAYQYAYLISQLMLWYKSQEWIYLYFSSGASGEYVSHTKKQQKLIMVNINQYMC